eukprot:CAMPEP_0169270990 /NCGR_PEP_ID=MMETSP1016-20121227/49466_1 /TAXON_ID=342587 /ORGANISM="Karlodinium micrum, Strain CCMP2283" /LENGTH=60 /DNA_ID=CAMNT_0009356481 /DNA_START=209 /DNA_END=388 /DNA_ORIENTATION=+
MATSPSALDAGLRCSFFTTLMSSMPLPASCETLLKTSYDRCSKECEPAFLFNGISQTPTV